MTNVVRKVQPGGPVAQKKSACAIESPVGALNPRHTFETLVVGQSSQSA